MPTIRRRRSRQESGKSKYLLIGVIVIVVAAVGWYALSSNKSASPANASGTSTASASAASGTSSAGSGQTKLIYAKIGTSMGLIEVELFPGSAPKTVANFVNLAKSGFYDNLVWHRIVNTPKPFVIQTGDPLTRNGGGNRSLWGTGGSSITVPLEIDNSLHNDAGFLGMARSSDPNSGSSQFYINLANNPALDGQYTVFGKVISGMDVVSKIANVLVNSADQPIDNVFVTSITIQDSP